MGVRNGPAMFQRMISWILLDLPSTVVYIDDALVGTPECCSGELLPTHYNDVGCLLNRFRSACMGVKGKKVYLFRMSIKFCGQILSNGQRRAAPSMLQAIREWRHQSITTVRRLKSFMGLSQHYAQFFSLLCRDFVAPHK